MAEAIFAFLAVLIMFIIFLFGRISFKREIESLKDEIDRMKVNEAILRDRIKKDHNVFSKMMIENMESKITIRAMRKEIESLNKLLNN